MSMIQISNENIEKLERFQFLLEDENIIETLDFILNAFSDDIEEFICQYLSDKEHLELINSDEYKASIVEIKRLIEESNLCKK